MDKVIFLDIDGVLNTGLEYSEWNKAHDERQIVSKNSDGSKIVRGDRYTNPADDALIDLLFGRHHVRTLNDVCDQTGAKIVVSSSWRMFYALRFGELRNLLRRVGVTADVLGPTPTIIPRRYDAVWAWLRSEQFCQDVSFVCLDDEEPPFNDKKIQKHVCLIDPSKGLRDEDIPRILKKLEKKVRIK